MPPGISTCDGIGCAAAMPDDLASELWITLSRGSGFRWRGASGRTVMAGTLVFHSDACMAVWIRTHLIESR